MKASSKSSRGAGIALAFLLFSSSATGLSLHGFTDEEANKIEDEVLYLKPMGEDRSNLLSISGLPNNGQAILRRMIGTFAAIVSSEEPIKGCIKAPAKSERIPSCSRPFEQWKPVYPKRVASVVNGVQYIDVRSDSEEDFSGSFYAGPTRKLALENKKPFLIINESEFKNTMGLDTGHAVGLLKVSGMISSMRMYEAKRSGKEMPGFCDYGVGLCDKYRNGPVTQAGAFLIYAANQCGQCSAKSKAVLASFGLKTLAGSPGDSRIDPIELSNKLQGGVVKRIFPDSLKQKVRMNRLLHEGISPLM